jgi:putative membrane protein
VSVSESQEGDVTRRTWLAAERTWLAWWRSGVAVGAVALAVGRLVPGLAHGRHWPFRVLGIGYGVLSVVILLVGARRQHRTALALRRGSFDALSSPLVAWLTAGAVALSIIATILVLAAP